MQKFCLNDNSLVPLQNAKNGTYKLIGDTFRKYPNETLVANTLVGVNRAVEGGYGFLEVLYLQVEKKIPAKVISSSFNSQEPRFYR